MEHNLLYICDFLNLVSIDHADECIWKPFPLPCQYLVIQLTWMFIIIPAKSAKSLQSCPTVCDPTDGSPPGSAIPEILQARTLEWVAISFSNAWNWKVKVKSFSCVRLLATPWTAAYQAPPSMGFSSGVGCHCLLCLFLLIDHKLQAEPHLLPGEFQRLFWPLCTLLKWESLWLLPSYASCILDMSFRGEEEKWGSRTQADGLYCETVCQAFLLP